MKNEVLRKNIIYLLLITFFSSLFLFYNLGSFSFNHLDEGLFASIAYEMEESGDYAVLSVRGEGFFHKQPLRFWFNVLSIKLFGTSNFSFRFFSAFFSVCLLLCVYRLGSLIYKQCETGLLAVFILLGSPHFLFERMGRNVEEDSLGVFLASLFFLLMLSFFRYKKKIIFYSAFFILGLMALTKLAFCGFVFLVFLIFLIVSRRVVCLREMLSGIIILLLVALPWHIWQYCAADINFAKIYFAEILHFLSPTALDTKWAVSFFGADILSRLGGKIVMGVHADVFYYLWVLLIGFFPWIYFAFLGAAQTVLKFKKISKSFDVLPLLWFLLPLLMMLFFYEKRTWRINLITPALALVTADFIIQAFKSKKQMLIACILFAGSVCFYQVNQYGKPFYTPSLWGEHYLNTVLLPKGEVLIYGFYFLKLFLLFAAVFCAIVIGRLYRKAYLKIVFGMLTLLVLVLSCSSSFLLIKAQTYKSDMEIISSELKELIVEDSEVEIAVVAKETTKMFHARLTPEFSDYSDGWADYFYLKVLGDKNIVVVNTEFERMGALEKYKFFVFDKETFQEIEDGEINSDFIFDFKILKETGTYLLVQKQKQELL